MAQEYFEQFYVCSILDFFLIHFLYCHLYAIITNDKNGQTSLVRWKMACLITMLSCDLAAELLVQVVSSQWDIWFSVPDQFSEKAH